MAGFTFSNDGTFPGNNGLHDAIKALEWIQTHISSYGGDPNRVTVFGQSAGGSLAGLLLVSPLAEGNSVYYISCSPLEVKSYKVSNSNSILITS